MHSNAEEVDRWAPPGAEAVRDSARFPSGPAQIVWVAHGRAVIEPLPNRSEHVTSFDTWNRPGHLREVAP